MARMDRKVTREHKGSLVLVLRAKRVRRASAVCANHQRLAGYLLISKCQWEQKAVKVNQAPRGHQDLQVLGLKANRAHRDCLVPKEKRVSKEIEERMD